MEMKNENRFRKFLNKNKLRRNQLTKRDEFKDLLIYLVFVFVTTIGKSFSLIHQVPKTTTFVIYFIFSSYIVERNWNVLF